MSKNILIIGASSGIGKELAKQLLKSGYAVFSASRTNPELEGINHTYFDALTPNSQAFEYLPSELHGLVYCPGNINLKPFHRLANQDFEQDFKINVLGAINAIQLNLSKLKASKDASVVLFSTVAVQTGMGFHASVATSKGAIEGLTRSLAAEYANNNIRFNSIAPSLIDTPLAKNLLASDEKRETAAKRHPLNRIGGSGNIASLAKWLISDEGNWTTGKIFTVDGGIGNLKTF